MRFVAGFLSVVALAASVWIGRLPDKAECVASGRVVDPTERHCQTSIGYQQLQEHALFHSSQVLLGAGVLVAGGWIVRRYYLRRRSPEDLPTG